MDSETLSAFVVCFSIAKGYSKSTVKYAQIQQHLPAEIGKKKKMCPD